MQINSISPNFTGKRENIQTFINLDDKTLKQAATLKTLQSIDTKKHKKLDKALVYGLPAAIGLKAAANVARGNRLKAFGFSTAGFGLILAGISAGWAAEKFITRKSETLSNFAEKHPILSFIGGSLGALAVGGAALRAGDKLFDKVVSSKVYGKTASKLKQTKLFANASKYASKATKFAGDNIAKLPSALKGVAKVAANWAPTAVIIGSILHIVNHAGTVNRTFAQNYGELKEKQLNLARKMNTELQVQNDFLLTKPENKEELSLVKNPTKDLPQEVLDKIVGLKA